MYFNGRTLDGKFDCVATLEKTHDILVNSYGGDFRRILDAPEFVTNVYCPNKDVTRRGIVSGGNDTLFDY